MYRTSRARRYSGACHAAINENPRTPGARSRRRVSPCAAMSASDLDEPHWYLNQVAVDPAHQGHGVGAALVEVGLLQARETRAPAFLVAAQPRNVGYYERFGFRTVFDGDPPDGGPHCWFMRYDA